jgi:Tol biopolymer transport system component
MTIGPGARLGPYEVTALLGEGGMGKVWRAHHTALKRDDALKVLPDAFASDPDRLARFRREAQVLASLNHPNIAHVYGLEQSNGVQALVMELIEGPTLADRIARGPIPVDEALRIAKQIAEALEVAHEQGIIHRDLKPANIKLRPDGTAKVLDFGLAKALEPASSPNLNATASPTITSPAMMTGVGVLLGTAAYMSPEQAKGLSVDKRTDIFSFGNILYEMLTGRRAFAGDTVAEVLARVIEREPDWSRLPRNTPDEIQHLLRRSLQKDRNRRLQTATDVRVEIEESSAKLGRADEKSASTAPDRREGRAWKLVAAVLFVAVVALAIPSIMRLRETPAADAPEMRVDLIMPANAAPTSFAISPDGRRVVFVASSDGPPQLWLRPLDGVTAQPLAGTEGAALPFWSPDSRSVGFYSGGGNLRRLDIGGGLPQTLASAVDISRGTWSSDGTILFSRDGSLFRIAASGGDAVRVTNRELASQGSNLHPQFLPGDRQFLFYSTGPADAGGIYFGSLDVPETKRLTAADTAGLYVPPGWLLYIRRGALVARRFDPLRGELTGDPVTVADPVGLDAARLVGAFSVSASGLVAYRSAGGGIRRQLTWFDRSGKALGTLGAPDESNLFDPALSPDGRRVSVERTIQGNTDIWIVDDVRTTRFTFDAGLDVSSVWSPDGSRIVFQSNRKGSFDFYEKPSNGAGGEEVIFESAENKTVSDWSRDGRFLIGLVPRNVDLWVWPLDGDRKPRAFLSTEQFDERGPHFSPDGRWVSYHSNESGRNEVYVRPFPGPGGQWQISTAGGSTARWRHNGRELYYVSLDGKLMAVPINAQGATLDPGTPVELFRVRSELGGGVVRGQYAVAPDGRFLVNVTTGDSTSFPITLLLNWKPPAN